MGNKRLVHGHSSDYVEVLTQSDGVTIIKIPCSRAIIEIGGNVPIAGRNLRLVAAEGGITLKIDPLFNEQHPSTCPDGEVTLSGVRSLKVQV